jgi:hypothetical protein
MKKCFGLVLIGLSGISNGDSVTLSLHASSLADVSEQISDECAALMRQTTAPNEQNQDLEGIDVMLNAFTDMIKGAAFALYHPNDPAATLAGMSTIITSAFKVIAELAKHKNYPIDTIMYVHGDRGPRLQYTLEAMEHELMHQQVTEPDPVKQIIKQNVASIAGNCVNIIADHHNPHTIGSNVANIVASLINIAAQFSKNSTLTRDGMCGKLAAELLADEGMMHDLSNGMHCELSKARLVDHVMHHNIATS